MPAFCRHNRFAHRCPICQREEAKTRAPARPSARTGARAGTGSGKPGTARRGGSPRAGALVTRKLARAADDGYRHDLIPGVKATEDAERLAACLAYAAQRLEFPGPYPAIAEADGAEAATWLAFLLALAGPDRPELQQALQEGAVPAFGEAGDLATIGVADTVTGYWQWVQRAGTQEAAITGDPGWPPVRRFARAFERLTVKGFGRAARFEFLSALGAAGIYDLEADALHVDADDATVTAAKRALLAGEWMLLERRAARLAEGTGVPLAALDRGLALWDSGAPVQAPPHDEIRAALHLG